MKLLDMMLHRRSVRQYIPGEIPEEALTKILQAGMLSASGRALRPWELIVIRNPNTLQVLSGCRTAPVKMLQAAACAIAVVADGTKSDLWVEDCSIVMANMHLMADSLGLGSCWVHGRLREAADGRSTEEFVRDILKYPETHHLEAILALGVIDSHPAPHELENLPMDKVHYETF